MGLERPHADALMKPIPGWKDNVRLCNNYPHMSSALDAVVVGCKKKHPPVERLSKLDCSTYEHRYEMKLLHFGWLLIESFYTGSFRHGCSGNSSSSNKVQAR